MWRSLLSVIAQCVIRACVYIDLVLRLCGVQLVPVSKDLLLAGLPPEVKAEADDPEIREPLQAIIEDAQNSKWLDLVDRLMLRYAWRDFLTVRTDIKRTLRRHPAVEQVKIVRPVFLVGLPRTGTTLLHRLLACDPRFFTPMLWEYQYPSPAASSTDEQERGQPGRPHAWRQCQRYRKTERMLTVLQAMVPDLSRTHSLEVDAPEECYTALLRSGLGYHMMLPDPNNTRWSHWFHTTTQQHMRAVYTFHKKQLQLIGFNNLGHQRCLLKANVHLLGIEALQDMYPDARFIFSFRPLSQVVPSLASHNWLMHRTRYTPDENYGYRNLKVVATLANRLAAAATQKGQVDENPFYMYSYEAFLKDTLGVIRAIYSHIGEELTPEVEDRMNIYLTTHSQHKDGDHFYKMNNYGLTKGVIKKECHEYIDYMTNEGVAIEDIL